MRTASDQVIEVDGGGCGQYQTRSLRLTVVGGQHQTRLLRLMVGEASVRPGR